jgi:hypothetical protein
MRRSSIPSLRLSRFGKRAQYLVSETLVLIFGLAACQVFETDQTHIQWAAIIPCIFGYLASFALLLTTRCGNCGEPVGRNGKRLMAFPHANCQRCGASLL